MHYVPEMHYCARPHTNAPLASLESTQGEVKKEITASKLPAGISSESLQPPSEPFQSR